MSLVKVSDPRHLRMRRVDAEAAGAPPSKRSRYESHLLDVAISRKTDVDLIRHLSERAKAERAPGQTLQSKMNELRREFEFAVPSHNLAPHCAGGAARRG